jgi:hypothetical protein
MQWRGRRGCRCVSVHPVYSTPCVLDTLHTLHHILYILFTMLYWLLFSPCYSPCYTMQVHEAYKGKACKGYVFWLKDGRRPRLQGVNEYAGSAFHALHSHFMNYTLACIDHAEGDASLEWMRPEDRAYCKSVRGIWAYSQVHTPYTVHCTLYTHTPHTPYTRTPVHHTRSTRWYRRSTSCRRPFSTDLSAPPSAVATCGELTAINCWATAVLT